MFICIQIKTQTPQYLPYMTPAEKMIYRLHTSSYLIVTNCRCFITVFYTDRHKILYDLLICNKKPRSFVRNRVFVSQSIFPPAWFYRMEPFNGLSYIGIAIMIPIRNLLYFGNFIVLQLQERELQPSYFIQSRGSEDLLHPRLDAVAHDELPRLLPDLPILTIRGYCAE